MAKAGRVDVESAPLPFSLTDLPHRGSPAWRYSADNRGFLLAPRALIFQVAHPMVGAAVADFSEFKEHPFRRLNNTVISALKFVYGGPVLGEAECRRLWQVHQQFKGVDSKGRRYSAMNPEAYAWVHATLIEAIVRGHAHFGRPIPRDELNQFYAEWCTVGRMLGVRENLMPPDWDSFLTYFDDMVQNVLEDNESVRDVLAYSIGHLPRPTRLIPKALWRPAVAPPRRMFELTTIGTLPPVLRERFGLEWTDKDERQLRRLAAGVRAGATLVPPPLRLNPLAPAIGARGYRAAKQAARQSAQHSVRRAA